MNPLPRTHVRPNPSHHHPFFLTCKPLFIRTRFPVLILSPFLEQFAAPEGGYKFINGRGEEQDADTYIKESEIKLAQQAAERMEQQEQNPLFPPPFPAADEDPDAPAA